jgi:hypothetical protein
VINFSSSALALTATLGLATLTGCSAAVTPAPTTPVASASSTANTTSTSSLKANLTYLIEEEKLAFDVYTALNELWGAKAFGNILQSEASHQSQVLSIMTAYGVADPRSAEAGVFVDPELQKLYDSLMAQGTQSLTEAYKVGVLIEETDIADLQKMLAENPPADVATMMNSLLSGSQNHLAAFSKKL